MNTVDFALFASILAMAASKVGQSTWTRSPHAKKSSTTDSSGPDQYDWRDTEVCINIKNYWCRYRRTMEFRREYPSRSSSRSPSYAAEQPQRTTTNASPFREEPGPAFASYIPIKEPSRTEQATEKRRLEFVKLLQVALQRLRDREKPPSVFDAPMISGSVRQGPGIQATVNAVRGAVRLGSTGGGAVESDTDNEDGPETPFSTEPTYQLLTRVRDTLIIHGDKIFLPV